ncbi:MAG: GTP 3',8-cyclase MoaA [Desulfobacterales bacterium]|nr:GTP 3',8-cyclase MoaA [Desulfobacteraceae bacterium]MDD3993122.1 GTP 3',8-cyclase MoaA [Desulfobacteraceae bacterium]MDY0312475.1 GTP 3',8-cyclase MoaA [Desulfobacterales bacterium]
MIPKTLIDPYKRHLSYLRISITDRCNLRCIYCMPREMIPKLEHADVLRYEEILRVAKVAAGLGITKLRVTGGEPLVRRDVCDLLTQLNRTPGIREVSLTTNGVLLTERLDDLLAAGVRRINVSLDSLKPERFAAITRVDCFQKVWDGIMAALDRGMAPVKINVVALRGINDDELPDLAALSLRYPVHVRFIEQMPIGEAAMRPVQPLLTPEIKTLLAPLGRLEPVPATANDGPAERHRIPGAPGEIGFISALSHHFCDRCNRLRLTASGGLRPCLLSDHEEDMRTPLRQGASDVELAQVFLSAVRHKPARHHLAEPRHEEIASAMSGIGG